MGTRVAAFLDRDGTINEEVDFLRSPDQLRLIPGAAAAIRALNDRGIITCVISNQSGIARGFLTEEDLVPIHAELQRELGRAGARVDRIYYCPHHPTEGKPPYNIACGCRKPATGMLERGIGEMDIDPRRSFVVGDRIVDVQAGRALGATTILVLTGYGRTALEECRSRGVVPDQTAPSIVEAVEYIVSRLDHHDA
ncbi:MAG: histidinol-phosphate phosphatase family protein [Bacteroidetes bacterium]|nr:histidinol-phosphate phosphatase family protein [Bacteroidota bacterium]